MRRICRLVFLYILHDLSLLVCHHRIKLAGKTLIQYSPCIGLLLLICLACFWQSLPAAMNALYNQFPRVNSDDTVANNNFEMATWFSELQILIDALAAFIYICVITPMCLVYALYLLMREFVKVVSDFVDIPEVKQIIKMCTM